MVWTNKQPWETPNPEVVYPVHPGNVLELVAERLLEGDGRKTALFLFVDPATLNPLPSRPHIVCVLHLAVVPDTDLRLLHVGSFGKDHSWWYLKSLMEGAIPQPPPMHVAVQGSLAEVSTDIPTKVAPLLLRASGNPRGVRFHPCIVLGFAR